MTHNQEDVDVLIGALLWLRNHYDVGDPALKGEVLRQVDRLLDQYPGSISARHSAWRKRLHAKG